MSTVSERLHESTVGERRRLWTTLLDRLERLSPWLAVAAAAMVYAGLLVGAATAAVYLAALLLGAVGTGVFFTAGLGLVAAAPADQDHLDRYAVTYAFDGYLRGDYAEAVSRIHNAIEELHREQRAIEFCGATLEVNEAGQLITATARYAAPNKGTIGRVNCRAMLPACGQPERIDEAATDERTAAAEPIVRPNGQA